MCVEEYANLYRLEKLHPTTQNAPKARSQSHSHHSVVCLKRRSRRRHQATAATEPTNTRTHTHAHMCWWRTHRCSDAAAVGRAVWAHQSHLYRRAHRSSWFTPSVRACALVVSFSRFHSHVVFTSMHTHTHTLTETHTVGRSVSERV